MGSNVHDPLLAEAASHSEYGSIMDEREYTNGKHGDSPVAATSLDELSPEARVAAEREHDLTFLEAVAKYPTAIAWAMFFSLGVIM